MTTRVTIQFFDGCPSWRDARSHLEAAARELGVELDITEEPVETIEGAERLRFVGSPTILLDGKDPFAPTQPRPALACRVYATPGGLAGSPSVDQLVAALRAMPRSQQ
jgi:hypothetical protein